MKTLVMLHDTVNTLLATRKRAACAFTVSFFMCGTLFGSEESLAKAQALLDDGRVGAALQIIEPVLRKNKKEPHALLLRSTARIMEGDLRRGFEDLQLALKLNPKLRQGWLNLAGIEIAEGRFNAAEKALLKAQQLDPTAADNHLNLGAVIIFQGRSEEADQHFAKYLEATHNDAESFFLVAANYSLAGKEERALTHLDRAILLDERIRLRARTDERFVNLSGAHYWSLLTEDRYQPPPDAYRTAAAFAVPYSQDDTKLLYAVADALQKLDEPYHSNVEATADWALIWADFRIKLSNQKDGTGVVQISALRDAMTEGDWQSRTRALFAAIHSRLNSR